MAEESVDFFRHPTSVHFHGDPQQERFTEPDPGPLGSRHHHAAPLTAAKLVSAFGRRWHPLRPAESGYVLPGGSSALRASVSPCVSWA